MGGLVFDNNQVRHRAHRRWSAMKARLKRWIRNPTYILAVAGLSGFAIDMLAKPISNAGLILLGVACAPWITRLIKSGKLAGFEFVFLPTAPPAETAARLAQETDLGVNDQSTSNIPVDDANGMSSLDAAVLSTERPLVSNKMLPAEAMPGTAGRMFAQSQQLALTYLLEGLVLQDLQQELDGFLQREVSLDASLGSHRTIDGLIVREGEAVAIEVKLFFRDNISIGIVQQAVDYMSTSLPQIKNLGFAKTRAIVAVVAEDLIVTSERRSHVQARLKLPPRVQLRYFGAQDLMTKYGFER